MFSQEVVELTIFRYRYMKKDSQPTKVVELFRKEIRLKPFLRKGRGRIDLDEMGNEFPPNSETPGKLQSLSIIPADEAQLYGENYDGQFHIIDEDQVDVGIRLTRSKANLRKKGLFSFEVDVPNLAGAVTIAQFRGRLKRGTFKTVLEGEGMYKRPQNWRRGNLHVELVVT
jgi:hypothetical protein